MDSLIISGGRRLEGVLTAAGAKNAALPILAATLLTPEKCVLKRVPVLRDISTMLTLLSSLGADITRAEGDAVRPTAPSPDRRADEQPGFRDDTPPARSAVTSACARADDTAAARAI